MFTVLIGIILLVAFILCYLWVVFETIIVVVFDNRNPVRAMAWVIVLVMLPFLGLILYFFFGRNTRKVRIINEKSISSIQRKTFREFMAQPSCNLPSDYASLISLFQNLNRSYPFDGNKLNIYTNGYAMLQSLLREIAKAKHHIHLEYYIFEDDAVGRLVRDALIDKVQQGVEVRLIYDDVGSWKVRNSFYDGMREAGIEVRGFMRVRFPLFTSRVNYRNHRKITVIDGQVGFLGGMNIASRYLTGGSFGIWRDTQLMIKGRGVHSLQAVFLRDWFFVDQSLVSSNVYFPEISTCGSVLTQIATSEPVGEWKEIMQGYVMAISQARRYVYIQTPYFLPTEVILSVIQTAALADVDVRIMIPFKGDTWLPYLGTLSYVEDVLNAGAKVYFYQAGFLHAKMMVCDDELCTVGSTNMDFRSFENNFEVNAFIYNAETAICMREIFLSDQEDCQQMTLKSWRRRSKGQQRKESLVRLISPLL